MGKLDGILAVFAVAAVFCGLVAAETYHLNPEGQWQDLEDSPQGDYLLAVSNVKQQLMTGSRSDIMKALEQLKADYPNLAGEQIDAYITAEKLYAKGALGKAAAQYKQFLNTYPDSVFYPVAMERLYSIGTAYLQGQKRTFLKILKLPAFDDGEDLMWDIAERAGNSPITLRALTTLAENQERREKYFDAYKTWAEISARWPTGNTGRQALLRMAEELHASYKGPQYDAGALTSARSYYEDFIARYPAVAEELNVAVELELIFEQQAYKKYETGFYYEQTGEPDVSKMYYERVISEWPDSKAAIIAQQRLQADAPPAVTLNGKRKLFDLANLFLDSWFGIERVFDQVLPKDGDSDQINPDIPEKIPSVEPDFGIQAEHVG